MTTGKIARLHCALGAALALAGCGASPGSGTTESAAATDMNSGGQFPSSYTPEAAAQQAAGELAEAFSAHAQSLPSYTLVDWNTAEIPPELAAQGAKAAAALNFEGATAMDPMAFRNLAATFMVFESSPAARAYYEGYEASAAGFSEIAVENFEVLGEGIPTSEMQCIADRTFSAGMTCLILEEDLQIVSLILFANGPPVESAYGEPVVATVGDLELRGEERWFIRSFQDDGFYSAVTTLNEAFHRYVNQTLGD